MRVISHEECVERYADTTWTIHNETICVDKVNEEDPNVSYCLVSSFNVYSPKQNLKHLPGTAETVDTPVMIGTFYWMRVFLSPGNRTVTTKIF